MAVVSLATLKTYFETGDFPTQAQFEDLIDTLANSSTSIYKRYVALLNQTGTDAPIATILENTLGGTVVWTRSDVGRYTGTLIGAFTLNKTWGYVGNNGVGDTTTGSIVANVSANSVSVLMDDTFAANDGMTNTPIEIRVYP